MSARQIQKLTKNDSPVFLVIVRANEPQTNEILNEENDLMAVRQNLLLPTASQKVISGTQINRRAQRKVLYLLKKESDRFSTVSLKHTGKTWKHS